MTKPKHTHHDTKLTAHHKTFTSKLTIQTNTNLPNIKTQHTTTSQQKPKIQKQIQTHSKKYHTKTNNSNSKNTQATTIQIKLIKPKRYYKQNTHKDKSQKQ